MTMRDAIGRRSLLVRSLFILIALGAALLSVVLNSHHDRSSALVIGSGVNATNSGTNSVAAVQRDFSAAMDAKRQMMLPFGSGVAAPWDRPLSAQEIDAHNQRGSAAIAAHFSGNAGSDASRDLGLILKNDALSSQEELDTGVTNVQYQSVTFSDPNIAQVHAIVTIWSKQAGRQPGGPWIVFNPVNEEDFTATLVQTNGHWLISNESWSYVPGAGP